MFHKKTLNKMANGNTWLIHMLKMDFKHLNEELRQTVVLLERITSYQEHTEDD